MEELKIRALIKDAFIIDLLQLKLEVGLNQLIVILDLVKHHLNV
jgi:hypothetical protein